MLDTSPRRFSAAVQPRRWAGVPGAERGRTALSGGDRVRHADHGRGGQVRREPPGMDRAMRHPSEDVEHQQQDEGQQGGDQERAETAEPVGEQDEHRLAVPSDERTEPAEVCTASPAERALHPFRGSLNPLPPTYGHHRSGWLGRRRPAARLVDPPPALYDRRVRPRPGCPVPPGAAGPASSPSQPHARCTSAARRSRAALSSGRSTGTGSAPATSTVSGNT